MKLTQARFHSIVHNLMTEMGLLDRPATPDEIAKICQAVLAETQGRKAEPVAPKLVVPEDPDYASAKEALFTVMRPFELQYRLCQIPTCDCSLFSCSKNPKLTIWATFAHQDEVRQVLTEFGICPARRKRPREGSRRPGSCRFNMTLHLPADWRVPLTR